MATTYPITEEQKAFLAGFHCERLKDDKTNEQRIKSFENKKGKGLVNKLKNAAWGEDKIGSTAYYVIKNKNGDIVLFFSLKCGVLFDPHRITNNMEIFTGDDYGKMWDAILTEEEAALPELQNMRHVDPAEVLLDGLSPENLEQLMVLARVLGAPRTRELRQYLADNLDYLEGTYYDKKYEPNRNIIRVPETFSAIELVEFCANTKTAGCWDETLMGSRSLGVTLFWAFIVPKMLEINDLIGSEYVFLFAADHDLKPFQKGIGRLIKIYQEMHFNYDPDLGTAKPAYDFSCQFMCQRLRTVGNTPGLDAHLKAFFDTFNENPYDENYV